MIPSQVAFHDPIPFCTVEFHLILNDLKLFIRVYVFTATLPFSFQEVQENGYDFYDPTFCMALSFVSFSRESLSASSLNKARNCPECFATVTRMHSNMSAARLKIILN